MSMRTDLVVTDRRGKVSRTRIYSMVHGVNTPTPGYMRAALERQASLSGHNPPITIIAANSSLLFFSLLKNTVLPQVRIEFYRPDPSGSGEMEQYYTIILTDAVITSNGLSFVRAPLSERNNGAEQIAIAYQKIEWAYNTSHSDSWSSSE